MDKRPALGKGLSALIPEAPVFAQPRATLEVDVDQLEPNHYQPRTSLDAERLDELARSIKVTGLIQPIVVRPLQALRPSGPQALSGTRERYEIIAGERRWRAAQLAGLTRVPVVVKDISPTDDRRVLAMALVENIQREDLNPMEAAAAYERLIADFHLTQEAIATEVGKDRATVANYLRLLKLPEEVRADVSSGALSMGHARAILALPTDEAQKRLAREVVAKGLSVRETEALVKRELERKGPRPVADKPKDVHTRAAEEQLRFALGTRVEIRRRGKGGTLVIAFTNEDELQRIYEYLTARR
jgi:ParB family chromosome partitioning protein